MALERLIQYANIFRTQLLNDITDTDTVLVLADVSGLPEIGTPLIPLDFGRISTPADTFIDYESIVDPPDEFIDYGAIFPETDDRYYYLSLFDSINQREIVKVVSALQNAVLVERGADGSTAIPFEIQDRVDLWFVRGTIDDIQDDVSDNCDALEIASAASLADAAANEGELNALSDDVDLNTAAVLQNTEDIATQSARLNSIEMVDLQDVLANGRDGFIEAQNNSGADSNNRLALAADIAGGSSGSLLHTLNLTDGDNGVDFPLNFPDTKRYILMWSGYGSGLDYSDFSMTLSVDSTPVNVMLEEAVAVGATNFERTLGGTYEQAFISGSHDIAFSWSGIDVNFLDVYIFSAGVS